MLKGAMKIALFALKQYLKKSILYYILIYAPRVFQFICEKPFFLSIVCYSFIILLSIYILKL